jgi:hypothetical protein
VPAVCTHSLSIQPRRTNKYPLLFSLFNLFSKVDCFICIQKYNFFVGNNLAFQSNKVLNILCESWMFLLECSAQVSGMLMLGSIFSIPPWRLMPLVSMLQNFFICKLRIFVVSWSVCHWQAFPAYSNVYGKGQVPTQKRSFF